MSAVTSSAELEEQFPDAEIITTSELIELCAADGELFEKEFFPETVRQPSASFHKDVWRLLESSARLVNIQMFRGSAKTTKLRIYMAKRIAYGLARTIMYVGLSQDKAVQSVSWMRKQVEHNRKYSEVFKLKKGSKWQDTECKIDHELLGHTVTILAYGVTGSIRGVNIEDYRPDLIIVDDIIDEENAATEDQRDKIKNLLYGALVHSLAPRSEAPDAKLVMLQTPINKEDASTEALNDPSWVSARHGCWTKETEHLPDDDRESSWADRFTTEELRQEKKAALKRNTMFTFLREMECKCTAPETASFRASWLNFYDLPPDRDQMVVIGAIDPVPPPTDAQIAKGLKGKDYEALVIMGAMAGNYYLLEYMVNRGHDPNWTIAMFFELSLRWNPSAWVVEEIAYQKTLEWILRKEMRDRSIYYPIHELRDKRSKFDRIVDAFQGTASNGALYVHKGQTEFISQFSGYPDVTHVDVLDAGGMCMVKFPMYGVGIPKPPPGSKGAQDEVSRARAIRRRGAP